MLVVVHHRDVKFGLQGVFDFEAFRSLDVFEVDTAECRGDSLHDFDKLPRILLVDFDVEHIDTGINLEEQGLAFHHRLTGESANITEAEHGRTVRNHCDQVSLAGVFVSEVVVLFDFEAGNGYTRSVGEAQVGLRAMRLGRHDFDLAGLTHGVIFEGFFLQILTHSFLLVSAAIHKAREFNFFAREYSKNKGVCKDFKTLTLILV